jgi:hypothetical protein
MSAKVRKTRTLAPERLQQARFPMPEGAGSGTSFQAMLDSRAKATPDRGITARCIPIVRRAKTIRWQKICSDALIGAWSYLHTKYKTSTTKRLHVSETISLGEKRFVAIVAVEGREFLIGGGASGMSLLAELGTAACAEGDSRKKFDDGGKLL